MFFTERTSYEIFNGKPYIDYLLADTPLHVFCIVEKTQPVTVYAYSTN